MDRINVDMHGCCRLALRSVFSSNHGHRRTCGKYISQFNRLLSIWRYNFFKKVLNLFLALLLSSFDSNNLKSEDKDDEINKIQEAIDKIKLFALVLISKITRKDFNAPKESNTNLDNDLNINSNVVSINENLNNHVLGECKKTNSDDEIIELYDNNINNNKHNLQVIENLIDESPVDNVYIVSELNTRNKSLKSINLNDTRPSNSNSFTNIRKPNMQSISSQLMGFENNKSVSRMEEKIEVIVEDEFPPDCFPGYYDNREKYLMCIGKESKLIKLWDAIRLFSFRCIENKYFESFIIVMIIISSVSLVR